MENGSPVYPDLQVQIGLWFTTIHCALSPHVPGHGSMHFWLEQAMFNLQSVLTAHSGRQFGGFPIKPRIQTQTACPLTSLHWLLGPHGEGWHKLIGSVDTEKDITLNFTINKYTLITYVILLMIKRY